MKKFAGLFAAGVASLALTARNEEKANMYQLIMYYDGNSQSQEDNTNDLYTENSGVQEEGVAVGDFILDEYEDLPATGVFKGKVLLWWFLSKKGKIEYNDGYLMADPYLNNAYIGTWTSKQTHKSQQVSWVHYRVPCAGDLDMGAGEFSPAPEYYKYGWDEYIQEIRKKYPDAYYKD